MKFNTPLSFICSKCPTFLMVLPALEMSPMQPSFLHPALCTPSPKKLIYKTRPFFIHLAVFAVSFSPLSSCKLEMKIMHICTLIQCTCLSRSCWHFLCAGTWVIFWKPQANYLLDLDIPYILKMCLSLNGSITAL